VIRSWLLAALLLAPPALAQETGPSYAENEEAQAFIRRMVEKHGFVEKELLQLFSRVRKVDQVIEAMERPAEKTRTWPYYRATFLDEKRIAEGIDFWRKHRRTLERAERNYGVPAPVIIAIIGVETFYGRNTGRWRVVDALSTLAFDYPQRAPFFRGELENYLLFARDRGVDVFAMRGSYAGAMGMPQFMPGSARSYGVDFDRDGHVDLRRSVDAIGSVGNFLKQHGWRKGGEVMLPARVSGEAWRSLGGGLEPKHAVEKWREVGVDVGKRSTALASLPATLVELPGGDEPSEFRLGFRNFYVLTRYNRSALYASAVNDLAQALRARAPKRPSPPQSAGK
jgi:membrane-bound lytic murein transglycosylase B